MMVKYWNMYNSGVDGQAVMLFLEKYSKLMKESI
jgi:hypothetical protein